MAETDPKPLRRRPLARPELKAQRLVALFVLGCLLFSYPLLALFNVGGSVFGIPVLYAYLFAVWAALIVAMVLVVE
ncbi:MAG: hypothetical protein AB1430_18105 [Pseudomonadota bacterium]